MDNKETFVFGEILSSCASGFYRPNPKDQKGTVLVCLSTGVPRGLWSQVPFLVSGLRSFLGVLQSCHWSCPKFCPSSCSVRRGTPALTLVLPRGREGEDGGIFQPRPRDTTPARTGLPHPRPRQDSILKTKYNMQVCVFHFLPLSLISIYFLFKKAAVQT